MMKKSLSFGLAVLLILAAVMVAVPVQVTAEELPRLTLNKTSYLVGEDIFVTATGTGTDWVGLYAAGDTYDPGAGGQVSILWYYVADDGNASGNTKNIRDAEHRNEQRASLYDIPAGEYKMVLMKDGGYSVVAEVPFRVIEVPTAYVRDGLVAWYDGVENTRDGQDTESVVWHDKAGGYDLPVEHTETNAFEATGFHVRSGKFSFPQGIVDTVNGKAFTVELRFSEFVSVGGSFNTFLNSGNDNFALFRRNKKDVIEFKFAANPGSERPTVADGLALLQNALVTVTYEVGGQTRIYINGEEKASAPSPKEMGADTLFIGQEGSKAFDTVYRSIRFYDRALNPAEVAHNAVVDGALSAKQLYVADGLVAVYSGTQNRAGGNDLDATVWADLCGGNDITLTTDQNNRFELGGFRSNSVRQFFPQAVVDVVNGQAFTVEMSLGDLRSLGTAYNTFINSDNDNFSLFRRIENDVLEFKYAGNGRGERPQVKDGLELFTDSLITVTYEVGGETVIYADGMEIARTASPRPMGADNLFFGHDKQTHNYSTLFRDLRFYNRALSAEEVLANAKADLVVDYDYTEPEKVFKATFVANNKVVAVVEFAAGATSIEEPEVPAREGFTGAWAAYTVENKNFTVRAIYTLIPAQTETGTGAVTETATAPVADTATEAVTTAESGSGTEPPDTSLDTAGVTGTETGKTGGGCSSAVGGGLALTALMTVLAAATLRRRKH